jgi:tRNA pseudouridine38-40 synthase
MVQRVKLVLAYDGTPFAGWQSQAHGQTIQDNLEKVFEQIFGQRVVVNGAGRTDAGAHAIGQCAHADVPDQRFTSARLLRALNGLLPGAIRVMKCSFATPQFHARYSAIGKLYRYRIWTGDVLPPFEQFRAWHLSHKIDVAAFDTAARRFLGQHDFRAFAANRGHREMNCVRNIRLVRVRKAGAALIVDFEGDGFLYKMVRMMIGAIVRCGYGEIAPSDIDRQLVTGSTMVPRLVAPAAGLVLVRVRY